MLKSPDCEGREKQKLPTLLLTLGAVAVKREADLRRYQLAARAFKEKKATSLRKAQKVCLANCVTWAVEEGTVGSWEKFRQSMADVETLFCKFFGNPVELFVQLGEGMPWIGLTETGEHALELADELLEWCEDTRL